MPILRVFKPYLQLLKAKSIKTVTIRRNSVTICRFVSAQKKGHFPLKPAPFVHFSHFFILFYYLPFIIPPLIAFLYLHCLIFNSHIYQTIISITFAVQTINWYCRCASGIEESPDIVEHCTT